MRKSLFALSALLSAAALAAAVFEAESGTLAPNGAKIAEYTGYSKLFLLCIIPISLCIMIMAVWSHKGGIKYPED